MNKHNRIFRVALVALAVVITLPQPLLAADYVFPIIGGASFSNDFDAPRASGPHRATDIFANKMQKIVSRTDGVITLVNYPEQSWGFAVFVRADNGYTYQYIHMNNDSPGTDNHSSDPNYAYGPDIQRGKRVVKGQLLGYVGDSGNAEETPSHLHLEIVRSDESRVNPYDGLKNNSDQISSPVLAYPKSNNEIIPSSTSFTGGYTLAVGDVNGDGKDELIAGPGEGGKQVKVMTLSGKVLAKFEPNGPRFLGGVDVAAGDINGDGKDEIVTGAGPGGRYVKTFDMYGNIIDLFQPNGPRFLGGVDVAAGDINGDGKDEIVTGAGPGGRLVKVFDAAGAIQQVINPYNSKIGVSVATGNFDSDPKAEIVTGARKRGGPRVNVYDNQNGTKLSSFYVYRDSFKGGIKVASANVNSDNPYDEVVTLSQVGGLPHAKISKLNGGSLGLTRDFAEEWWNGYYDIVVDSEQKAYASMGVNRRSTIRPLPFNN